MERRDFWQPEKVLDAIRLLQAAHENLGVFYPHSTADPDPAKLKTVMQALSDATECIASVPPSGFQLPAAGAIDRR